ncbi:MAG: ATP-dependent DNA helicase RecG [Candidatus Pacebacteria bacterium]|jgi:ATP-dependent DNA helicase RecG|nr:ATP-dependent DNA helicase RecG [Candidatus Paceibacterota bacterium]MDP6659450.1 ATP-dependent DNA helicase RecG [Candidatus Paceibacterota bacterium]|tara:strand:+ start:1884 stop:4037 length:2154 start_codon:yes stop_codon:yes gene_type:complete
MHLDDPLEERFRLQESQKKALKRLNLLTIEDLLYHFPTRYENIEDIKNINDLELGDTAIVYGKVRNLKTKKSFKSRTPISEGFVDDRTGSIKIIWFHQPYIAKMLKDGASVKLSAKVSGSEGSLYLANPEVERLDDLPIDSHNSIFGENQKGVFYPIYPESKGITSKWFYHAIAKVFQEGAIDEIVDPVPEEILKKYNLPKLSTALVWIHTPQSGKDSLSARKRFSFNEVFYIQLAKQKEKTENLEREALRVEVNKKEIDSFVKRFPFKPTKAQNAAIKNIVEDFKKPHPMSRLLEGDVGSGKTAVAATTVYAVTTSTPPGRTSGRPQTAYMVPTEILAKQQFESFIEFFKHMPINIGLITSSGCRKFPSKIDPEKSTDISRSQLLKWVANGEIPILVGTHSLIQKSVNFENLAYVIIDEQHRFGTIQRQKLVRKDSFVPHLLSMTATPIPRTLALTIYGDLDLTLLDEMPAGRKPIITKIIPPDKRETAYEKIRDELGAGRQAYVICPRIDEPDPKKLLALNVKSVKEEAKRLKEDVFPEYEIEILHSKLRPAEKESVMNDFASGKINILVATSVVEVGVNVPNATVIVLEGAERFGLAQLHQLRGRVLRSNHQAHCFVFTDSKTKTSMSRLKALEKAKNGFELAEFDLELRGSGELYGRKQWGLTDIGMEAIKNVKMVEAARNEAEKLIKENPELAKNKVLRECVEKKSEGLHFE